MTAIGPFAGPWAFLSNFYPSPVEWQGRLYPTVENAFQAAKTDDPAALERLTELPPDQAAELGRLVPLRPDWEAVKLGVMAELLALKFEIPALRRRLLATGQAELLNIAWWGDLTWGMAKGRGANHLGRLLMELRAGLSSATPPQQ
jgi:hypothetical protein